MVYHRYLGLLLAVYVCSTLGSATPLPQEAQTCVFPQAILVAETTSTQGQQQILVQVLSNASREGVSQFDKEITGLSLPAQCTGQGFQICNALEIFDRFLVVPASGNLVTIDLRSSEAAPVRHTLPCDPINVFFDNSRSYMWVMCVDGSFLTHLAFDVSVSANGVLALQMDVSASHNTPVEFLTSFSETVMVSYAVCSGEDIVQLYTVIDGQTVWHFPITLGSNPNFDQIDHPLQNCDNVSYIEHSGIDESFTAHCANGISTEVSTCTQDFSPANFENSTRFSCSERYLYYSHDSVTVTFSNESIAANITHSLGPIQRGFCKDHFFLAITASGSLWVVHLNEGTVTMVAGSVCEGGGSTSCHVPSFSSENGFLVYDTAEGSLKSVRVLPDCGTPAVETYPHSALVEPSLYLARGSTHECNRECRVDVATTMGEQADDMTPTTDGEVQTPTTQIMDSGETEVPTVTANFNAITHVLVPVIAVVVSILAIVATAIIVPTVIYLKPCSKNAKSRNGGPVEFSVVNDGEFKEPDVSGSNQQLVKKQDEESSPPSSASPSPPQVIDYFSNAAPSQHDADTFSPSEDHGNGYDAHLVNSNDLPVSYPHLTPGAVGEKAREQQTQDRENDLRSKRQVV